MSAVEVSLNVDRARAQRPGPISLHAYSHTAIQIDVQEARQLSEALIFAIRCADDLNPPSPDETGF